MLSTHLICVVTKIDFAGHKLVLLCALLLLMRAHSCIAAPTAYKY